MNVVVSSQSASVRVGCQDYFDARVIAADMSATLQLLVETR
jgi:hypothetical protein